MAGIHAQDPESRRLEPHQVCMDGRRADKDPRGQIETGYRWCGRRVRACMCVHACVCVCSLGGAIVSAARVGLTSRRKPARLWAALRSETDNYPLAAWEFKQQILQIT